MVLHKNISFAFISCLTLLAVLSSVQKVYGDFNDQLSNKHSTLVANDGNDIRDNEFAEMIEKLLEPNDVNNARDAKFLFQQCYGGGMLDDIKDVLDTTKWVGGSASDHNEPSIGKVSTAENNARPPASRYDDQWVADPPEDWWTEQLKEEMAKDQTLLEGINNAGSNDGAGEFEAGQSAYENDGNTITLKDPNALSHHAILWAGQADAMRHFNDVNNVRSALTSQWGQPDGNSVTISVLFGDGLKSSDGNDLPAAWDANSATKENLQAALDAIAEKLDPNEQFFFYASDHGGVVTEVVPPLDLIPLPAGSEINFPFVLDRGELLGMALQSDNVPILAVEYAVPAENTEVVVKINGDYLGNLDPTVSSIEFDVDEDNLWCDNELVFYNSGSTDITILSATFSIGSIDTNPLPEGVEISCDYKVVDNFESYCCGEMEPGCYNYIWDTWIDGYVNNTGSVVWLGQEPGGRVSGGEQSMVFAYQNDWNWGAGYYSEAAADIADLAIGGDWTKGGVMGLSLWFYGDPNNDAEPIYVALEDNNGTTAEVYHGDFETPLIDTWQQWVIYLQEFSGADLDLASVKKVYIGVGNRGNTTTPGGTGTLYFDDLRLYSTFPECGLAGDINGDCVVNFKDVAILADNWLQEVPGTLCAKFKTDKCRYELEDVEPRNGKKCPTWAVEGIKCLDTVVNCVDKDDCHDEIRLEWIDKKAGFDCLLTFELIDCAKKTGISNDCRIYQRNK